MDYGKAKWKKKRLRILKLDGYRDRIKGMTYEEIGEKMNYHYSTCIKKLNTYLSQHSQKSQ